MDGRKLRLLFDVFDLSLPTYLDGGWEAGRTHHSVGRLLRTNYSPLLLGCMEMLQPELCS